MEDAKHTPGPWQVSGVRMRLGNEDCQCVGPDGFNIAFLPIGKRPRELAGALADARLIAAAPEMRDAIKEKLAADDAMLAFILNARPSELGEEEWDRQHRARSERGRAATAALRAALSKAGV